MKELERLFVASIIYEHNMRMIHWNCNGCHFDRIHAISDEYAEKFNDNIDSIAEMIMMLGGKTMSLACVLDFANDDTEEYIIIKDYIEDGVESYNTIGRMLSHIVSLYDAVSHTDIPADIISELQAQQYYFRLEGQYKNNRRLINTH